VKKINIESLALRVAQLRARLPQPEPWPPMNDGDLAKIIYDRLIAEGFDLPDKCPVNNACYYLLGLITPKIWAGAAEAKIGEEDEVPGCNSEKTELPKATQTARAYNIWK